VAVTCRFVQNCTLSCPFSRRLDDPRRWSDRRGAPDNEDPGARLFQSGRQFAAWIGLTPKDHSTGGKVRLGVITRAGDEALRSVLVVGATAVIQQAQRSGKASPWLVELLKRKSPKLAAVALANKTARIAWKMMVTGETYTANSAPARLADAV